MSTSAKALLLEQERRQYSQRDVNQMLSAQERRISAALQKAGILLLVDADGQYFVEIRKT